jgi:hypothetical protein
MEEYLIDYLIDEGYANTEGSAYKILEVISEGFFEYLLSEALTPEERASRRKDIETRRQQNRAVDPYRSTSGAQKDRPNPRGGELPTMGLGKIQINHTLKLQPEEVHRLFPNLIFLQQLLLLKE